MDEKSPEAPPAAPSKKHWQDSPALYAGTDALRYLMLVPVLATFVTCLALLVYGAIETYNFVVQVFFSGHEVDRNEVLLMAIEIVDLFLLATVVEVVSFGLYQLHFNQNLPVPKWLKIETLDDLKSKLVGVTVTVLAVFFLGQVLVSGGSLNVLYLGGGTALMIAALTYFLTKIDKD